MKTNYWCLLAFLCLGLSPAYAIQVVVGQVAPMTGLEAAQGRNYAAGMQLLFDDANMNGGVNGHTISLVTKDDRGRPDETVSATRRLLADSKPMVLAGYFGSPNMTSLVSSGLLERNGIAIVGYRAFEAPADTTYLYSVRATLIDELDKMAQHLATIGTSRIGVFYEEGTVSAVQISAIEEALGRFHISVTSQASYTFSTVQVAPAVELFIKRAPQAIILMSSGEAAASFIEQYRVSGGEARLVLHSSADVELLSKRLTVEQMRGVSIAQVLPSPYKIDLRLNRDFRDLVSRSSKLELPPSYTMMEGYIAARIIIEAVRRQGKNISRSGLIAELNSMNSYDLGGYLVGFKPGMHFGSRFVEMSVIGAGGRLRQ